MRDKKTISVPKLAALERAKALGRELKSSRLSVLERQALEWKRCEEAEKSRQSEEAAKEALVREEAPFKMAAAFKPSQPASESGVGNEGFDWQPYRPEQGRAEVKTKNLNSASIWCMARKMMAREWARALGRGGGVESEKAAIERKAEQFRQKKATERER